MGAESTPPEASPPDDAFGNAATLSMDGDTVSLAMEAPEHADADDDLGRAQVRARLQEKLFGVAAAPVRLGRFVLMDSLGEGGMGVVYSAYDPDLDRRVALKLLRTELSRVSPTASARLMREAQALARLSHPHVVPVYEVGVIDGQVFIVMEFVVGQTLREWAAAEGRTWRQVLDAYRQAGQGLAAAHAVGLVHRDFKPDNVLVGEDGRIRVLDFGLAREPDDPGDDEPDTAADELRGAEFAARDLASDDVATEDIAAAARAQPSLVDVEGVTPTASMVSGSRPASVPGPGRLSTPLTRTGAILGTPAYMPIEQFDGAKVGPASDQFSFCVSLFEALYGERPFAGDTLGALRAAIETGAITPPRGSAVPRWLLPILCRGLSPAAEDRYPSMEALLTELGRDPARRRRLLLMGALAAVLLGVSALSLARAWTAAPDTCSGAARELAEVWSPERERALAEVFSGRAYAEEAWPRIARGLDGYAAAWATMHEQACRAHQRGEQSGAMLDKRMACLERRKGALGSAVDVLFESEAVSLERAVELTQKLPRLDYCADSDALAAVVPPPEDPAAAARVDELRQRLSRASALEDAGRYDDALALGEELQSQSDELGYGPLRAEVALLRGRILAANWGARSRAAEPLRQATTLGLAAGMYELGVESLARSIFVEGAGDGGGALGEVLRPVYLAEALLAHVPDPTFVRALLRNNVGVVYLAHGQREPAREAFERALRAKRGAPPGTYLELAAVPTNLALVSEQPAAQVALLETAAGELERALGGAHPRTLEARLVQAHYLRDAAVARALVSDTCALYERYHPELASRLADCLAYLGALALETGAPAQARTALERAAALFDGTRVWLPAQARAQALLLAGEAEAALRAADEAAGAIADAPERWWTAQSLAEVRLIEGQSLIALGRPGAAIAPLQQALTALGQVVEIHGGVDPMRALARTRLALATALWDAPGAQRERERARALLAEAEAWYRQSDPENAAARDGFAQWRAARGLSD
ncbi:serine/threonine-protein kinase [Haliangium ochraceum]|uniref:Serine/threonine protein kinase n=1 Tax=Haliangium ochraceum (strain DSM 14365 / JCM 11303 / SMP-2) TaxID=502025 RepID=D0LKQ8_HALO1|nr:serine/threonine-protein kinase [Haliangium ochraceum]ACY16628.1 serine/threonine protein kinase [Haliangium ochraceum DSM 14365]